jgi:hypothetical protein
VQLLLCFKGLKAKLLCVVGHFLKMCFISYRYGTYICQYHHTSHISTGRAKPSSSLLVAAAAVVVVVAVVVLVVVAVVTVIVMAVLVVVVVVVAAVAVLVVAIVVAHLTKLFQ